MGFIPDEDTLIDDGGDEKRDDQFEGSFQELEQRAEHALARIALEIDEEFFQKNPPFLSVLQMTKTAFIIGGNGAFCNSCA